MSTTRTIGGSGRNSGIDALRGLSILSVLLLHCNTCLPFNNTRLGGMMPNILYKIIFLSGYYGVCIFFVISGFLITTSVMSKWNALPSVKPLSFYRMRFARIVPLLAVLLAVLSVLHYGGVNGFVIDSSKTSLGRAAFAALTFHINILEMKLGYLPGAWDILWSLSIEEMFYFFFPVICLLLRREWMFAAVIAVFLVVSPIARTVWFPDAGDLSDRNYLAYMDAIAIGCGAAIVTKRAAISPPWMKVMNVAGWALFSLVMFLRPLVSHLGLSKTGWNVTILAVGTAFVLIDMQKRLISGEQVPRRFTVPLRSLGGNSYEIYLSHMFVVYGLFNVYNVLHLTGEWAWGFYLAVIVLSGLLGAMVSRFISLPMNRLLREHR